MRVLSLFSGVGGLDLGIRLALPSAVGVCYVEKDAYCRSILAARMADGTFEPAPIHETVEDFDGRGWRGRVDLCAGGFPCQDISAAGRGEGIRRGNRSGLWYEFARIIGEVRPRYVYVENVAALLGRGMPIVLGDLARLGFDAEWEVVSATAVGAPHLRKRIFILAHANGQHADGGGCGAGEVADSQQQGPQGAARSGLHAAGRTSGEPASRIGAVADSCCLQPERGREPGDLAGESGAGTLGNAIREGLEEWLRFAGDTGAEQSATERASGIPLFPPGPGDADRWRQVLRDRPDLSPTVERGVRRVDARVARRTDRLRACGNGVIPLQAAVALARLAERLEEA